MEISHAPCYTFCVLRRIPGLVVPNGQLCRDPVVVSQVL